MHLLTDINGNEMHYTYDSRGRLTSVSAPYEIEAGGQATISIEYDDKKHVFSSSGFVIRWQRDADLKFANYICT
jgi:hypothetical protein